MAFIENTAFEARITNNEFDELCNITGKYKESSAFADCSAGLLCVRSAKLPCEGFTGVYNENAWEMVAATDAATANDVIYACNTYDVQYLAGRRGNRWAVGLETLGLGAPAGTYCTFTKVVFNGENVYRFGIGNVDGEIGENTYFTIDDGLLVPAAAAPEDNGALYFELRGTGNFVEGNQNSFGYVDVCPRRVVA